MMIALCWEREMVSRTSDTERHPKGVAEAEVLQHERCDYGSME